MGVLPVWDRVLVTVREDTAAIAQLQPFRAHRAAACTTAAAPRRGTGQSRPRSPVPRRISAHEPAQQGPSTRPAYATKQHAPYDQDAGCQRRQRPGFPLITISSPATAASVSVAGVTVPDPRPVHVSRGLGGVDADNEGDIQIDAAIGLRRRKLSYSGANGGECVEVGHVQNQARNSGGGQHLCSAT
jgi:Domain of unknown function (DUF397)